MKCLDNCSWFLLNTDGVQLNYKLWSGLKDCLKEHSKVYMIEYFFSLYVDFISRAPFLETERKASSLAKAAEMDAMHKEQFSVPVLKMNE